MRRCEKTPQQGAWNNGRVCIVSTEKERGHSMKTDRSIRVRVCTVLAFALALSCLLPGATALASDAQATPSAQQAEQQVTVSYEKNLPSDTKVYQFPPEASYAPGTEITLPTVDAGDYYELQTYGWTDTRTGTFYWSGQKVQVTEPMTLVAQWRDAQAGNPVSVARVQSGTGGTVSPSKIVQFKGKESPLVLTIAPADGYEVDTVTLRVNSGEVVLVQEELEQQGDAWTYTLNNEEAYGAYYDIQVTFRVRTDPTPTPSATDKPKRTPGTAAGSTATPQPTLTPTPFVPVQILTQPQDQRVRAGEDATFTVAASGSEPVTYQWQMMQEDGSWADLAGADAPAYTVADTQLQQSGQRYRCIVQNQGRALASNEVKLTVDNSAVPQTGQQGTSPWVWIGLVAVGAVAVAVALLAGRKKR